MASVRGLAVLLLLGGGVMGAQSTLPATGPTVLPAAYPQMNAAPAPEPAGAGRARVVWSAGLLEITADNSSLNQILREICRETGMKITGGVTDERVFGKYGPGAPAEILMRLLDGTGSNVLLRETASKTPAELILTPRQGGPTPPNPNAAGLDEDTPSDEVQTPQFPPMHTPAPQAQPMVPAPADVGAAVPAGMDPGTVPASGTADPASPNGVRTPQQIFQQLQQLQQAQQQQGQAQQPANPK